MGKRNRGGSGSSPAAPRAANQAVSLREETSGKTRVDEASLLRVKHLQRVAAWAGADAGVGSIGALLGRRLAASAEAAGVPLGAATFLCQRCETTLKPGFNCTVRVKNRRNKAKRRKKSNCCQNSVAYACHFCGDQNLILGSGKGVVKGLLSSREQGSVNLMSRTSRGNNGSTRKQLIGHCQPASLHVDSGEHDGRLKCNIPIDCKAEEGAILSTLEAGHLAASTYEEDSIQKLVLQNPSETELVSSENVQLSEANATSKAEFPVGSKFVTPQKTKLTELTDPKDSAGPFKANKKAESGSATGKSIASSSKSAPNDSWKHTKSAPSDSAQVSGSSRKRARKGWTTLKQMAEKDELERKEKMGNFVIPFFMQ